MSILFYLFWFVLCFTVSFYYGLAAYHLKGFKERTKLYDEMREKYIVQNLCLNMASRELKILLEFIKADVGEGQFINAKQFLLHCQSLSSIVDYTLFKPETRDWSKLLESIRKNSKPVDPPMSSTCPESPSTD